MSDPREFAQAVELTTATYDRAAANYAERKAELPPHWREWLERFVDLLAENEARHPIPELGRPGDDITLEEYLSYVPALDAGCGPGRDARALAGYGLAVLGVDLSQGMLDEAGARTPRRLDRGSVRYALMDLRRLELPEESCRGVWCSASLLHIPKRTAPRAAGELARVARAGAPVVVFLMRREREVEEELVPYPVPGIVETPRFYAYYEPEEARGLLEGSGLEILQQEIVPDGRPDAPSWVAIMARRPER